MLRARVVLPVSSPVLDDGAIITSGRRILAVGRWRELRHKVTRRTRVLDLGDTLLLPGLVNAHCHLDYTDMAGHFPPPRVFTDWLKVITEAKSGWGYSDYAESWLNGARMLVRTGTTTVGDIEALPQLLPEVWRATPLKVISFLEMIGITGRRSPGEILQESLTRIRGLPKGRSTAALSPHAPYSTLPSLLRLAATTSARRKWPISVHVAESDLEFRMFRHGEGQMYDWMQRSGREMADCGGVSPVRHLRRCGLLSPRLIAVHVNYLDRKDADLLGGHRVNVVHCPRSHEYFGHAPFPLRRLARAGANLCLGTDSLASVYKGRRQTVELSMFEEMRALAKRESGLSPNAILRMATINPARALGRTGQIGELSRGARADLIAVPFSGKPSQAYDRVLDHSGGVAASLIDGQWALPPHGAETAARKP